VILVLFVFFTTVIKRQILQKNFVRWGQLTTRGKSCNVITVMGFLLWRSAADSICLRTRTKSSSCCAAKLESNQCVVISKARHYRPIGYGCKGALANRPITHWKSLWFVPTMAENPSSGSSELHLAVASVGSAPVVSSPGEDSSVQSRSLARRSREDHRVQRSRSLGPYQASEGTSDLSGLEAGRFELD